MTYLAGLKYGSILAVLIGIFVTGYHFGGMASKTALEALRAAQAKTLSDALLKERQDGDARAAKLQGIIDHYESAPIDPIVVGLAHRLYAHPTASCPLPAANPDPGPAAPVAAQPGGDGGVIEAATQRVFDACAADAKQLSALIEAAGVR